jgi:hypothetical protein
MKMKNRFMVAFLTLVAIFAFSNLASAQGDPEGTLDNLTVDCNTNVYPGAPTVATFDIVFHGDNTGGNKIAGFAIPLKITGDCITLIDTTAATAFTGTLVSAFSILTVTKEGVADPSLPPFDMTYGAVNFTGGVTGTGDFCHISVTVDSTCCIVIDTTHTALIPDPNFITELAVGFIPGWSGPDTCCIEPYINQNPDVNCGLLDRAVFAGGVFNHDVLANDPDDTANICDQIVSSEFQFLDSTGAPSGAPNTYPCGFGTGLTGALNSSSVVQNFNWNTTGCAGGKWCVVFTYTDECGGSGADTCCYEIKTACAFVTIGEVTADPCQAVEVPVYLSSPGSDIGGFSFCIEFANADLTVLSVRRGELINAVDPQYNNKYKWHYFTYRLNPSTVIHKYKVCVIGIGRVYSAYPGICLAAGSDGVLFYIKFVLACNELFRCHDTHVCFEWDSWTCLDNTLSDCTGKLLYVSDDTLLYPLSCGLGEKNEIIRCVHFQCGRVIWRCPKDVDPIVIGDVNVNGFPYEIADAVCFADYFVSYPDPDCFSDDPDTRVAQIGATDINRDGYPLHIADLVYLLRIITGDQAPLGEGTAVTPASHASIELKGHLVNLTTPEALGAIVLTFKGEGKLTPMTDFTVMQNSANGETKAIVYTMTKKVGIESGSLFSVSGTLVPVSAEAATYDAQSINVDVAGLPKTWSLSQNYPNPFNATTQISFALPQAGNVALKIYNVAGQLVKSFNQEMQAGNHTITWDGINSKGDVVASGVYFYKLDVDKQFSKTLKMTLLK